VSRASKGGLLAALGAIVSVFDFRGSFAGADLTHRDLAFAPGTFVRCVLIEKGSGLFLVASFVQDLAVLASDGDFAAVIAAFFRLFRIGDALPRGWRPIRAGSNAGEGERGEKGRNGEFDRFHWYSDFDLESKLSFDVFKIS
jgi:hypothetical protein